MRLLQVKCPSCAAAVSVQKNAEAAVCDYCGTRSMVSRRTRFLERRIPPSAPPSQRPMPVAVQRHSRKWIVWVIAFPLLIGLAALAIPLIMKAKAALTADNWGGKHPMVADVNGDGTEDILGVIHELPSSETARLVAYDGKTGEQLWRSVSLGKYGDAQQAKAAVSGKVVVYADIKGSAMGFDVSTGAVKWKGTPIGEKATRVCDGGDEVVWIDTADKRRLTVSIADGSVESEQPIERGVECPALWSREANSQPGMRVNKWPSETDSQPDYLGEVMQVEWSLSRSSDFRVALGRKKKGTGIPYVGAYRQSAEAKDSPTEVLWTSPVPSADPLNADTGAPDHACMDETTVFVGYETKDDVVRVASFNAKTGARGWEIAIPKPRHGSNTLAGLAVSGDLLLVSTWRKLHVFERSSGKLRFEIGK